jgi:hypothetical protein
VTAGRRIDEARQHREPADPVGERVVEHEHQRDGAIGKAGDQRGRPQWRGPRQPGHDH